MASSNRPRKGVQNDIVKNYGTFFFSKEPLMYKKMLVATVVLFPFFVAVCTGDWYFYRECKGPSPKVPPVACAPYVHAGGTYPCSTNPDTCQPPPDGYTTCISAYNPVCTEQQYLTGACVASPLHEVCLCQNVSGSTICSWKAP